MIRRDSILNDDESPSSENNREEKTMFSLSDRSRRRWTLFLFVLLGPGLLTAVLSVVCARYGNGTLRKTERSLSQYFQTSFNIQKIEFVRPGEERIQGLTVYHSENDRPTLFCPEIQIIRKNETVSEERIESFARSAFNRDGSDASLNDLKSASAYEYWIVPRLFVQLGTLSSLRENIFDQLSRISKSRNKIVFFRIDEIEFLFREKDLRQIVDEFKPQKFDEKIFDEAQKSFFANVGEFYSNENVSLETIQGWMKDFDSSSQSFRLNHFQGLFADLPDSRRWSGSFCFDKIATDEPIRFMLRYQKERRKPEFVAARTFFELDAENVPFPCSFASLFSSIFQLTSRESWFTGRISAAFEPTSFLKSRSSYSCDVARFHLFRSDVVPLAKRATSIRMNGTIADLYLEKASINDGVFSGSGSIFLKDGSFDRDFLLKLRDQYHLIFEPANALSQRFDDDLVPFDEFAVSFQTSPEGVSFDSQYSGKIISIFRQNDFQYRVYLPQNLTAQTVPYQYLLSLLGGGDGKASYWSPFYRDAMNHLPTDSAPVRSFSGKNASDRSPLF